MLHALETGIGLDIVLWLQEHGNPFFDALANALHQAGLNYFWLIVLPAMFWSVDKRLGKQMLIAMFLTSVISTLLKEIVSASRPFQVSDQVDPLWGANGGGIPSGHVMSAIINWGVFVVWSRRRWLWWVWIGYVLLVGWSRMYGGVHYPQDVLVAMLISPIILFTYLRVYAIIDARDYQIRPIIQVAVSWLFGFLVAWLFWESMTGVALAGAVLGLGLGNPLEAHLIKFKTDGTDEQRTLRYLVGIALAFLIFFSLRLIFEGLEPVNFFRVLRYAAVSFFAIFGWPAVGQRLGLFPPREVMPAAG